MILEISVVEYLEHVLEKNMKKSISNAKIKSDSSNKTKIVLHLSADETIKNLKEISEKRGYTFISVQRVEYHQGPSHCFYCEVQSNSYAPLLFPMEKL